MSSPQAVGELQEPASTLGFNDFFADASHCEAYETHFATQVSVDATYCEYSIIEASQLLKVSPSTIYRRIKAGKYQTTTLSDGTVKVLVPRVASQCEMTDSQDATQREASDSQPGPDASQSPEYTAAALAKALIEMSQKLEGANFRIGWLESQMQERDKEIKLLTDSQHKPSRWACFKKWFLGQ